MESFKMHWPAFLIAFAVGISYVYFIHPRPKVVLKYPNPYNSEKLIYQDEANSCFKYKAEAVPCTENISV